MILWIVLTMMAAVAAALVAAPFLRRVEKSQGEGVANVAIYRDQLSEIEREASEGLIDAVQAEAAKTEIKRRALAASQEGDALAPGLSSGERTFAAIGVSAVVVIGSVGLFALTANFETAPDNGSPEVDQTSDATETPGAGSAALSETFSKTAPQAGAKALPAAGMASRGAASLEGGQPSKTNALPSVEEMIQRIVKRLDANPKEVSGWKMLGWSYAGVGRYGDAAEAYAKAIALAPGVAELRSARAEALVRAANGVITPAAKALVVEALDIEPKDPRGRYFRGLAKEQEGDKSGAIAEWSQLVAESDSSEPFIQELKQKLAELQGAESGAPQQTALSVEPAPPVVSSTAGRAEKSGDERGPSAEDLKKAESMNVSDQNAMVRRMVDSLAARLEKSPHDADGWIKLIRSRIVLQENGAAKESLDRALKAFDSESADRERIIAAARELGLTQ
jgi:cytochrome c-type biogenesis protein CcmH